MSTNVNFCLFLWTMYTSEDCQPIAWLIIIKLLGGICQKHATYTSRGTTLTILYQVILLLNVHSFLCIFVSINLVNLWRAPACSLIFIKVSKEAFVRHISFCTWTFHKETHYIGHSLSSNSASKCPISSIFVCFYELSIPMKIVSVFLDLYELFY